MPDLDEALGMTQVGEGLVRGEVQEGWDVFGIPHGGYLAALAGAAVLEASAAPDLFTITIHYLRKAAPGPIDVRVDVDGGSRRFTSHHAVASQDGTPIMAILASVGDRSSIEGPMWTAGPGWQPVTAALSPRAGDPSLPFQPPAVAQRLRLRMDEATVGFARGEVGEAATIRAVAEVDHPDQLTALIACDVTPPAVWNALGAKGWVPTVELTAHVRARPTAGPLNIEATTTHVDAGFLNEDALVHDASGRLIVQSRQLARWTT